MHNRFDILFSLEILHAKYPPPSPGAAMPVAPDFGFEPTSATRAVMRQNGIGLKSGPGRCTVFIEKSAKPDGINFSPRAKTAASMGLNFFLRHKNGALISVTKPFNTLPADLPLFSGQKRVLYFNNKSEFAQLPVDTYSLTNLAVDKNSFASAAPDVFDFKTKNALATAVEAKAFAPGATLVSFAIGPSRSAQVHLPENGYEIAQKSTAAATETIFFSPDALPEGTVGVVQVFPFQSGSSPPLRRYQIYFE